MKARHLAIPLVVIIAVIAWNLHQWNTLQSVKKENAVIENQISSHPTTSQSESAEIEGATVADTLQQTIADGPIDWRTMAARLAKIENSNSPANVREMERFQGRLASMSDTDLIAAIDEIQALGLDDVETSHLEEILVEPLIEKNPKLALEKFADRAESDPDGVGWYLSLALGDWAKLDSRSAAAWLDERIASGAFESKALDGTNESRLEFEAALAESLLATDPQAVGRRIEALPEDQRNEILSQISFGDLDESTQLAAVSLIRTLLPEKERIESFADLVDQIAPEGDFADVDNFLKQAQATPAEREAAARLAVESHIVTIADERPVTRADLDEMRGWLAGHAPESVDRMTGQVIADAAQDGSELGFAAAEKLVREFQQSSGNDDVIEGFLESYAEQANLKKAISLAALITDDARREKLLYRLKHPNDP